MDVYWNDVHFWAFNVADAAITVGAALVILDMLGLGRDDMHPILFEIGGFPVYTYGVLLAAAYLLGLQFALVRARARGLDGNRVMDLGIWIIISALIGAKLLLLIVDFDTFRQNPARAGDADAIGRRVLRRPDRRGRGRALVPAPAPAAGVDRHGRVRAGHRARPRRSAAWAASSPAAASDGPPTFRGR